MLYIIDTETNGLPSTFYPEHSKFSEWPRMQSIAFKREHQDFLDDAEEIIVKADFAIDDKASAIHGITEEVSREQGVPVSEALLRFSSQIEDDPDPVLCAYNVEFDRGIILSECYRNNLMDLVSIFESPRVKWVCLMKRAHRALDRGQMRYLKLCDCVDQITTLSQKRLDDFEYHSAKGDVRAAAAVLRFLIDKDRNM